MQIGDRLVGQPAKLLGPRGALAQHRDQRLGARQQFFEARRRRALVGLCLGHCAPLPHRPACAILLLASRLGDILFTWGLVKAFTSPPAVSGKEGDPRSGRVRGLQP